MGEILPPLLKKEVDNINQRKWNYGHIRWEDKSRWNFRSCFQMGAVGMKIVVRLLEMENTITYTIMRS